MEHNRKIRSALVSVYDKTGLEPILKLLHANGVQLISTGGTHQFILSLGIPAITVESLTGYPSILDGRVKTLHPAVFGGILARREDSNHLEQLLQYKIREIDLVIVDLYPFAKTVEATTNEEEIIEKIDIGGISLIRGAAKNFADVLIIPSVDDYSTLEDILSEQNGISTLEQRRRQAARAFAVSSGYDTDIFNWFNRQEGLNELRVKGSNGTPLRYGENPHQSGVFFGNLNDLAEQLHGKELSYNNLLDIDAALSLISDLDKTSIAIIKHNNACGVATRDRLVEAWDAALAGDPVSAYGGVIISNQPIDEATAEHINQIFFEVIVAPGYEKNGLGLLKSKKNRIILQLKSFDFGKWQYRSLLNGVLSQTKNDKKESKDSLKCVTEKEPTEGEIKDLLFANRLVKHARSNAIVLVKNEQMIGSGVGQTSRVDAVKQAIEKAERFGFDLKGAVLASDAFFPFGDSVEIASEAGISSFIQPGGSVRDVDSIEMCNRKGVSMVFTGTRHFRH